VDVAASQAELAAAEMDIYSPCALGGSVDDTAAGQLRARIICGGANNQLAHPGLEKQLGDRGVIYVPDYVVNSGGVIQVADELHGFSFDRAKARAAQIFDTTRQILTVAEEDGVPPVAAADRLAERRISDVGRLRGIWLGG
jgi:valine dehydrogenase (NAD+)